MATTTGTHVNFVKVPTMAKFNDITTKVDGTVYFIVDAKKIYLDGVMYGFNDSDIDLTPFLKRDGTLSMSGNLNINLNDLDSVNRLRLRKGSGTAASSDLSVGDGGIHILAQVPLGPGGTKESNYEFTYDGELIFLEEEGVIKGLKEITDISSNENDKNAISVKTLKSHVINKIGVVNGIAGLDNTGKVPSSQLPSYVDDVKEYSDKASFPATGESDKLYIDLSNNRVYRWGGSAYVNVSDGNAHLQLGTTSSTAYRGDYGNQAYLHISKSDNPHAVTASQVGLGKVENLELATKEEAELGTSNAKYMTPQRTKEAIEKLAPKLAWTVVE